jgi:succinate dehydrogenase/fumarate reductase flavoprotein subunit
MAGLVASARARELGVETVVLEKGDRAGGSMLISSCVLWRYRTFEDFRRECPGGDPELQRLVWERLDEGLAWLESLGAPVVTRETGNELTVGVRFDPRGLTEALVGAAGDVRLGEALPGASDPKAYLVYKPSLPLVLATGGFAVELARRRGLLLRGNRWSEGDGLRFARARGAAVTGDLDEFYGRNLPASPPARFGEDDYVRLAQLYGRHALVVDDAGSKFAADPPSWSETDLVQATAAQQNGRAWYVVDGRALGERVRERTVAEMVSAAEHAGGEVRRASSTADLGLPLPLSEKLREAPFAAVHVQAAVTHTIGGLRVDLSARVLDGAGEPVPGLYAAGADVGGISTGGYASGLASALVLGLVAAEAAAQAASGGRGQGNRRFPQG